jgi:hypothetical protein
MANTYLTRSLSSTSTSWTFSAWVKRGSNLGVTNYFISWGNSGADATGIGFNTSDKFQYYSEDNPSNINAVSNGVYRDTSGWYNFVCSCNAGAITLYTNGETVGSTTGGNALDTSTMQIGKWVTSAYYHDGSMSHINFIDGTAYDASAFGSTDSTTGEWKINTSPSVTYGSDGFFILKDGNSVTDQSGNGNNFTVAGGTLTKTEDSPSNVFATANPLDQNGGMTFSEGNLSVASTSASWRSTRGTLGMTAGKYYWEVKAVNTSGALLDASIGIADFSLASQSEYSTANPALAYNAGDGSKSFNGSNSSYGATYNVGDIIGVAFDADNLTVEFFKNGTSQGSISTGWSSGITWTPIISLYGRYNNTKASFNFGNGYFGTTAVSSAGTNASGNGIFEYDVPTGYTALSTKGLNL